MALPNLSNLNYVAWMRHVQAIHERGELANPDWLAGSFLSSWERWKVRMLSATRLEHLRRDPFYYYLLARTKHYDQLLLQAVEQGARRFINIGAGADSRAYRFAHRLRTAGVEVVECDQPRAVQSKRRIARRWRCSDFVRYASIDLNVASSWTALRASSGAPGAPKALVVIEGVSPYIDRPRFQEFLQMLGRTLSAGSTVAYDFKLQGVKPEFGVSAQAPEPFRLTCDEEVIRSLHRECGLSLDRLESGADLTRRLLPSRRQLAAPMWAEDGACVASVLAADSR
jgi:methyltransferase (TIGR00027 family)